nr:hypothetical protein Q903MT_gene775 [Picea sitchensis]
MKQVPPLVRERASRTILYLCICFIRAPFYKEIAHISYPNLQPFSDGLNITYGSQRMIEMQGSFLSLFTRRNNPSYFLPGLFLYILKQHKSCLSLSVSVSTYKTKRIIRSGVVSFLQ